MLPCFNVKWKLKSFSYIKPQPNDSEPQGFRDCCKHIFFLPSDGHYMMGCDPGELCQADAMLRTSSFSRWHLSPWGSLSGPRPGCRLSQGHLGIITVRLSGVVKAPLPLMPWVSKSVQECGTWEYVLLGDPCL